MSEYINNNENPTLGVEGEMKRLQQLKIELAQLAERAISDGLLSDDVAHAMNRASIDISTWER